MRRRPAFKAHKKSRLESMILACAYETVLVGVRKGFQMLIL
jgi:hypothetical protein